MLHCGPYAVTVTVTVAVTVSAVSDSDSDSESDSEWLDGCFSWEGWQLKGLAIGIVDSAIILHQLG